MLEALGLLFGTAMTPTLPSADLLDAPPVPVIESGLPAPVVAATSALIVDLDSGVTMFEKDTDRPRAIASLTKLTTALVVRDAFAMDEVVTISRRAAGQEPAKAWLVPGEEMTVEELLNALLVGSANDAAVALAEHFEGGEAAFVAAMNAKAKNLGLTRTHFVNPTGLDADGHVSTARAIAITAGAVWRDPILRAIVGQSSTTARSRDGGQTHALTSTNKLFGGYLNIRGLKTGSTDLAGECFAGVARTANGSDVLAIVLDSPDRFQEVKNLLDWATRSHR